jgi:hypothetical protein
MSIQNLDHEHTGEKCFNLEDIYDFLSKNINFHELHLKPYNSHINSKYE